MKIMSRRDLCGPLAVFAGKVTASTAQATPHPPKKSGSAMLVASEVFCPEQLPVTASANGRKSWDILHGVLTTGRVDFTALVAAAFRYRSQSGAHDSAFGAHFCAAGNTAF